MRLRNPGVNAPRARRPGVSFACGVVGWRPVATLLAIVRIPMLARESRSDPRVAAKESVHGQ